jgi:hypothetical protein
LEQLLDVGGCLWSSSITLLALSLGGMVLQGIDDGCGVMYACGMVEPSGVMVPSTAGLARLMRGSLLKMESRKMVVATSVVCVLACAESLLDWMCFSPAIGGLERHLVFWMM